MTDLALVRQPGEAPAFDLAWDGADLLADNGLYSAILVSLLTDARATDAELAAVGDIDPRGWAGEPAGDPWGSKLWLLARAKQTEATRLAAERYTRDALGWSVRDGIAASVTAQGRWLGGGHLALASTLQRPDQPPIKFGFDLLWLAERPGASQSAEAQRLIRLAQTLHLSLHHNDWPFIADNYFHG